MKGRLLCLGLCALVVVGLAEGAVRLRQWVRYGSVNLSEALLRMNTQTGLPELVPKKVVGRIRMNSLGFRGPEIPAVKPADTTRLAFLGASTNFCAEVSSNDMVWPHLVWKHFSEAWPEAFFDYVNAGVAGYSVGTSLKQLELRVKPLRPDIIVIYHAANDLANRSYELAKELGLPTTRQDIGNWPARYSVLWFLVEKNIVLLTRQYQRDATEGKLRVTPRELSTRFETGLNDLVRASQALADVVAVATFSVKMRREQPPADQTRFAAISLYYVPYLTLDGLFAAYDEYNRVIREVARRTGALLIDSETSIPGDDAHFVDSIHFADAGSRAMAERVSRQLLISPAVRTLMAKNRGMSGVRSQATGGRL